MIPEEQPSSVGKGEWSEEMQRRRGYYWDQGGSAGSFPNTAQWLGCELVARVRITSS